MFSTPDLAWLVIIHSQIVKEIKLVNECILSISPAVSERLTLHTQLCVTLDPTGSYLHIIKMVEY